MFLLAGLSGHTLRAGKLLAAIFGTLQVGDEIGDHPADAPAKVVEPRVLIRADILLIDGNLKLCSYLPTRTFGDEKELDELRRPTAFEAFCDVRHDGNCGAAHLIHQAEVAGKGWPGLPSTGFGALGELVGLLAMKTL